MILRLKPTKEEGGNERRSAQFLRTTRGRVGVCKRQMDASAPRGMARPGLGWAPDAVPPALSYMRLQLALHVFWLGVTHAHRDSDCPPLKTVLSRTHSAHGRRLRTRI
jgi:hypothetical protein